MVVASELSMLREKAVLLKALSNPVRLCIVRELLRRGECNVSSMQVCLDLSQSTVSQHLGRLRDVGIITGERKKTAVYYRVSSKEAADVITALF
ncbi:MAG TPA: metalloregulator ArsR/SmtB family transcription factor [Candidatus Limnocylindrales bacterium]|nr:metalloregulator ArsR/SmtB family transcription factor [Candidatus Limnocylindrales bacterium]